MLDTSLTQVLLMIILGNYIEKEVYFVLVYHYHMLAHCKTQILIPKGMGLQIVLFYDTLYDYR